MVSILTAGTGVGAGVIRGTPSAPAASRQGGQARSGPEAGPKKVQVIHLHTGRRARSGGSRQPACRHAVLCGCGWVCASRDAQMGGGVCPRPARACGDSTRHACRRPAHCVRHTASSGSSLQAHHYTRPDRVAPDCSGRATHHGSRACTTPPVARLLRRHHAPWLQRRGDPACSVLQLCPHAARHGCSSGAAPVRSPAARLP